jgi:hypothetical protein
MNVVANINVNTPMGRKIVRELETHKKVVKIENPLPMGENGLPLKTYSSEQIEDMVWDQLSDHYGVDVRKL